MHYANHEKRCTIHNFTVYPGIQPFQPVLPYKHIHTTCGMSTTSYMSMCGTFVVDPTVHGGDPQTLNDGSPFTVIRIPVTHARPPPTTITKTDKNRSHCNTATTIVHHHHRYGVRVTKTKPACAPDSSPATICPLHLNTRSIKTRGVDAAAAASRRIHASRHPLDPR